jgi:hypothetical protein
MVRSSPVSHAIQEGSVPIHGSLFTDYRESQSADPFSLQNKKMLKSEGVDMLQCNRAG